jgi:hypothetical protein
MSITRAQADAIAAANAAEKADMAATIATLQERLNAQALAPGAPPPAAAVLAPAAATADLKGVRLPEFWSEDPQLWFEQAEAAFETCLVARSRDRYNLVLARLSPATAKCCRSLIIAIRASGALDPYEQLRAHLSQVYGRTDWQLGFALLDSPPIGDRRPSDLLQDMRALMPSDDEEHTLFKCLFLRRLPAAIRDHLLAVGVLPMDQMAVIADRMHDASPSHSTAFALSAPTDEVNAVQDRRGRSPDRRDRQPQNSRGRGRGGGRGGRGGQTNRGGRAATPGVKYTTCHYHRTWGAQAINCAPPCDWPTKN